MEVKKLFIILIIATSCFVAMIGYCWLKVVVYAPDPPQPFYKDGVYHDPPLSAYEDYYEALRELRSLNLFLQLSPILVVLLGFLWLYLFMHVKRVHVDRSNTYKGSY